MRFSKLIIKTIAQKGMAKFGYGHKFHDLKYFEVYFHISWIHHKLKGSIKSKLEKINLL